MQLINILLNIILFLVISQISTISHEFGHAIPALIFSKEEVKITFGIDNGKLKNIIIGKLNIELRGFSPFVGFVCWNSNIMTKGQRIVATAGGPIVSLIIGICLLIFTDLTSSSIIKQIIVFSAYYHLYQFAVTSIPIIYPKWWAGYGGYSSDGYKVLQLARQR